MCCALNFDVAVLDLSVFWEKDVGGGDVENVCELKCLPHEKE